VEGCTFRGDIKIPTPTPPDSEHDDSRAPWEREEIPKLDPHNYRAPWEYEGDDNHKRKLADESCYREPIPQPERFVPSAAFTRSRDEDRSSTPSDEFDRYLAESFRPATKPLLPATTTPARDVAAPRAATTDVARAARAAPSSASVARRLSYSNSEIPVVLLCLMKTLVSTTTQTWTPMTGRTNHCMMMIYCIISMLPVVHATLLVVVF
jgi:hypothetical protein